MSLENRGRVLRAATSAFLAVGYRTSVDSIARRAGVAKQTVYHHFPSKDELFKEVARDLTKGVLFELEGETHDVRASLLRFAIAYRRRVLGADGLATFRTLVAEIPRFRSLAKAVYAGGAGEMVRRLSAFLGAAMDAERLRRDDPQFAAEMLLSMLGGYDRIKRLYGVSGEPQDARRTARIVDCFLRAYTVEPT